MGTAEGVCREGGEVRGAVLNEGVAVGVPGFRWQLFLAFEIS